MINEKEFNKIVAQRSIMSIWNTRRKPSARSKIRSNSFLIPNKKAPQNAK